MVGESKTVTTNEVNNVGNIHGGAGKLATAVDVEKEVVGSASALPEQKVTASSGAVHPDVQPGEEGYVHFASCFYNE